MKLRNREVNIFSMSALDLFASGMGAFILLAFVALPFFPHTATDAQIVELTSELEQTKQERDRAQREAEQAQREADELAQRVSELEVPDLDLVICLDVTGSMGDEIEGLKDTMASLAEILNKMSPTGIGLIAFGDDEWSQTLYVQEVTTDIGAIQNFLEGVGPNMDYSNPPNSEFGEAVSEALERAERLNWRPQSEVRHIVVITDRPAQDRNAALAAASRIASANNSYVSAVMVNDRSETRSFMRELADRGQGEFVDGNERSILGAILLAALG